MQGRKILLCALRPEPSDSRREVAKAVGFKHLHTARFGNDVLQGTGFAVRVPKGQNHPYGTVWVFPIVIAKAFPEQPAPVPFAVGWILVQKAQELLNLFAVLRGDSM